MEPYKIQKLTDFHGTASDRFEMVNLAFRHLHFSDEVIALASPATVVASETLCIRNTMKLEIIENLTSLHCKTTTN